MCHATETCTDDHGCALEDELLQVHLFQMWKDTEAADERDIVWQWRM